MCYFKICGKWKAEGMSGYHLCGFILFCSLRWLHRIWLLTHVLSCCPSDLTHQCNHSCALWTHTWGTPSTAELLFPTFAANGSLLAQPLTKISIISIIWAWLSSCLLGTIWAAVFQHSAAQSKLVLLSTVKPSSNNCNQELTESDCSPLMAFFTSIVKCSKQKGVHC